MRKKSSHATRYMTSAVLSDALLHEAYKMPTGQMATKRAALLCSALSGMDGERLPLCYGDEYCGLLSCPRCRWREQRVFMLNMLPVVRASGGCIAWSTITIIPEFGVTEVGALPKGGLRGFRDQIRAAVRKVNPNARAAMCVDINVERTVGKRERWQWHVHGIIAKLRADELSQLCQRFSWRKKDDDNGQCYRPVMTADIYDLVGHLAYVSKPQFRQREHRPNENGDLKFEKRIITIQQELHFVKVLSSFKVKQRLFNLGIETA